MSTTSQLPPPVPRRRLRLRFTLRLLLVAVTALCVPLGVWTHRARAQKRVVDLVEKSGGAVCYENDGPNAPYPRWTFAGWVAQTLGRDFVEDVVGVDLFDCSHVKYLESLSCIERLSILDSKLTDADVKIVARCTELRTLHLYGSFDSYEPSHLTDRSLAAIAAMPKLERLDMYDADISAAGIRSLGKSPSLKEVVIGSCRESVDAGDFEAIQRLGRIESLTATRLLPGMATSEVIFAW